MSVLTLKYGFERPTPIQSQSIPSIMSGRDVVSIASTGSGKTLAYLIPMFRHILDQRKLAILEGPIGLVLVPTRELAVQITLECKKFTKYLSLGGSQNLRVVCAFGGADIKEQIGELKRGTEIVVATPGRLIDLLSANSGRVTNLKRTTIVVLDEADRMFDMGFEPQVSKILCNVRPDRQTLLFSATFPKNMEISARKWTRQAIEITAGGRSVVNANITQEILVIPTEEAKFLRLLEILGQYYNSELGEKPRILIFVDRQDAADLLFKELLKRAYVCISIHGGKDQSDRGHSLEDFKKGDIPILIATSVAARGLDVPELNLVINYDCPNHMEDYVHRVGRTGRAGRKGVAITLVTPTQERYAVDLVRALKASQVSVPLELQALADAFDRKVKAGTEKYHGGGFGGKGLEHIDQERDKLLSIQKRSFGEGDEEEQEEQELLEVDGELVSSPILRTSTILKPQPVVEPSNNNATVVESSGKQPLKKRKSNVALDSVALLTEKINARLRESSSGHLDTEDQLDIIAEINARFGSATTTAGSGSGVIVPVQQMVDGLPTIICYRCELDINDFPQYARYKVTTKDVFLTVQESTRVSIVVRGEYISPSSVPSTTNKETTKRLHLFIEGEHERAVTLAREELLAVLKEATEEAVAKGTVDLSTRYSVV